MSLNLNSLLNKYFVETSPLSQFFWRKEKQASGVDYPLPLEEPYVDFLRVIQGLHVVERRFLDDIREIKIETSYPYSFYSIAHELETLFYLLSGIRIKLRIIPISSRHIWKGFDSNFPYEKTVLFSGGLDSLCGALDLSKVYRTILAHCITNQFIFNKVLIQSNTYGLRESVLYCCNARTRETMGGISETRGLLFLSFAYAVAASFHQRSIFFCENGSQLLDVLLSSMVYPKQPATKNTNLIYVEKIQEIFTIFDNRQFIIEHPFKHVTKAEMLNAHKDRIRYEDTFSCFNTSFTSTMCGICWNCFIRRMSSLAIEANEPDGIYEINPFVFSYELNQSKSYQDRIDTLYHLLRFYFKVLAQDPSALSEIESSSRNFFKDPIGLATRFANDIFLGIMRALKPISENNLNALGRKAKELLTLIDKQSLSQRSEELARQSGQFPFT